MFAVKFVRAPTSLNDRGGNPVTPSLVPSFCLFQSEIPSSPGPQDQRHPCHYAAPTSEQLSLMLTI